MLNYYDALDEETQTMIDAITERIKSNLTVNNDIDLDLLMATLEKLNELKKEVKEHYKELEKQKTENELKERAEKGAEYAKTLKKGDIVRFYYGPATNRKIGELPVEKVTSATISVNFTEDMLPPNYITSVRNIRFEKLIIPTESNE